MKANSNSHDNKNMSYKYASAHRLAFLIDGQNYFSALAQSLSRAQTSIYISGWNLDSRTQLIPENGASSSLKNLLNSAVNNNPDLRIYILQWDYTAIFGWESEFLPMVELGWETNEQISFALADDAPTGAAQHHKIVTVDESVAYVGGIDLTIGRWDTRRHRHSEDLRKLPDGSPYGPYHDTHGVISGPAATLFSDFFKERWRSATKESIVSQQSGDGQAWPDLKPDISNQEIAIIRTIGSSDDDSKIRETERFHEKAFREAQRYIFIENQYVTSHMISRVLGESLESAKGPEIVIILPHRASGWLQQKTMDTHRAILLDKLADKDKHGRLGFYYPVNKDVKIYVHAKLAIIDDKILYLGSANLANRSMELDTECGFALELDDEKKLRALGDFRNDLLAEHLGSSMEKVREEYDKTSSLISTIENLRGNDLSLEPLKIEKPYPFDPIGDHFNPADMEQPVSATELLDQFAPDNLGVSLYKHVAFLWAPAILIIAGLAFFNLDKIRFWMNNPIVLEAGFSSISLESLSTAIFFFLFAGLAMLPMSIPIVGAFVMAPVMEAVVFSLIGSVISAIFIYSLGSVVNHQITRWLLSPKLNTISKSLARRKVLAAAELTFAEGAPLPMINLVSGASGIPFSKFFVAALITIVILILICGLLTLSIGEFMRSSSLIAGSIFLLTALLLALSVLLLRKILHEKVERQTRTNVSG